ncbi:hypothetical protein SPRG_13253 [Saprolegnia parasitica CBS 223.65]|uniref:C3H1-type domain-containing protein n=1 Tax=Saprolegnia parasitica (strain CBS 223.65) TaxID=695850 RepID=A0A067BUN1_SAPPC|nr:hypothetical protein SPRG_13253 [Saprolegnia parasitica CBS 223.65]KDO20555.1 hypothetical protein SPRG_13253 [Saprolegnia parasitica CBS 223.65]|eukprot:XP_012208744.1 hypothetical protein SPRG_13253 [Saprolegnia parasitica CBS 223.65]
MSVSDRLLVLLGLLAPLPTLRRSDDDHDRQQWCLHWVLVALLMSTHPSLDLVVSRGQAMEDLATLLAQAPTTTENVAKYQRIARALRGPSQLEAPPPYRPAAKPKHGYLKTKICYHMKKGSCSFGASCVYAHSIAELRPFVADAATATKAKICADMSTTDSSGSDADGYGSPVKSAWRYNPGPPPSVRTLANERCVSSMNWRAPSSPVYKPACTFYRRGACTRGDDCEYRHDSMEWNKIKTKLCANHARGSCTYGAKCTYAPGFSKDCSASYLY